MPPSSPTWNGQGWRIILAEYSKRQSGTRRTIGGTISDYSPPGVGGRGLRKRQKGGLPLMVFVQTHEIVTRIMRRAEGNGMTLHSTSRHRAPAHNQTHIRCPIAGPVRRRLAPVEENFTSAIRRAFLSLILWRPSSLAAAAAAWKQTRVKSIF